MVNQKRDTVKEDYTALTIEEVNTDVPLIMERVL